MPSLDDHQVGACTEVIGQGARDLVGDILLEHQPMREHIDEPGDPREPWDARSRDERDMRFALRRQEMMGAHEEERDPRRAHGTCRAYRKTPTERGLWGLAIAGQE